MKKEKATEVVKPNEQAHTGKRLQPLRNEQ